MKRNIVSIGIVIIILFLFNITQAFVWYVHPESTQNCIQDCLNACATGDTVRVAPGTYVENIVWPDTDGIKLISEYGRDTTFIDGGDTGRVITISSAVDTTTIIRGFTICNGYASLGYGAGMLCENSAAPIIEANRFTTNHNADPWFTSGGGGGLGCLFASPLVRNNEFTGNRAAWGGAIGLSFSDAVIYGNYITRNHTDTAGGGISCWQVQRAVIDSNNIIGNWTGVAGGGIWCNSSSTTISRNTIAYDTAAVNGAGVLICWGGTTQVLQNKIKYNHSDYIGGGMTCCYYCTPIVRGNRISGNTADYGAGIHIFDAWIQVDSCVIDSNSFHGVNCFPYTAGAGITIHNCEITDNAGYGLRSSNSDTVIDARYNWWGDSTGPYHPLTNPGGLGNPVSDYVDFDPWLWSPPIGILEQIYPVVKHSLVQTTIVRGVLNLQSAIYNPKSEIFLLDITGRKVADLKPGANNIHHLSPGVYFLRSNDNNRVTKIIVTR